MIKQIEGRWVDINVRQDAGCPYFLVHPATRSLQVSSLYTSPSELACRVPDEHAHHVRILRS